MNNSAFDEIMNDFFGKPAYWVGKEKTYPMNVVRIIKNDEVVAYRLEYALAGFNKEDIKISVNGNILKIEASMPKEIIDDEKEDDGEIIVYNGISYRDMSLSYKLMENADKKNITSKFENGLLKITIPAKVEAEDFNTIEIE
jgi:HSP20 family protein